MPTLKKKKNGDFIIRKNTDSVPSAPPVSTFQVDPIAVKILAGSGVKDEDSVDSDTFWSLYDIGLLETKNEHYDPTIPQDISLNGLTGLEGFDLLEQAKFLSGLLDKQPVDKIADSEPVLKIAAHVDQALAGMESTSAYPDEIAEILWDEVEETLSPTPFDPSTLFRVADIFSLDLKNTGPSEFGGTLIWTLFLNQFYRGLENPDEILNDLDESGKDTVHFQLDGFVVATTTETWFFSGPGSGLDATSEVLRRRICPLHDMHGVFLTEIPKLCKAQLKQWFPGNAHSAPSFGDVLVTGFKETAGYLIILPGHDSLSLPVITIPRSSRAVG